MYSVHSSASKQKYKEFKDTTKCDTELLAWGLDTFGLKFLDEIDSMHGFAYYKVKEQQLWLSRDHAGIKPLFYFSNESKFIFASEIKMLLTQNEIKERS